MNLKALFMIIIVTVLVSIAQVMYKFGIPKLSLSLNGILFNYFVIGGLIIYAIGAAILLLALQKDDLSTLYPIIATGYIWVMLMSNWFFNEELNYLKWLGVLTIVIGVSFVGFGSKTEQRVLE